MYGICLRYGGNATDAEEILQNGFIRLFTNLGHFRFEGPLEGWARSIFINAAISYNKKFMKLRQEVELAFAGDFTSIQEDVLSGMAVKEMLALIHRLPVGCRTIFNLYEIEGFKHDEIADQLGISVGTSKSQLNYAKTAIRQMLKSDGT